MRYARPFVILTLLGALCGFLLYSAYIDVKNRAIDRLNDEQLIFAKQAAKSIQGFFERYSHLLNHLAKTPHIASLNQQGKDLMQVFYETHAYEIRSITRVDSEGRILYAFPLTPNLETADLSDQEHIQKMIKTHKPVVSDVFRSAQGFDSIAFHVPVLVNDVFLGSLAILTSFDHLAKETLGDIKLGEDGYAWIISRKGVELYCPVPGHVGHSVFDNCRDFPDILAMAHEMIQGKSGTTTYIFDKVRGQTTVSMKKHAVFLPIQLPETFWSIVVATPERAVLENIQGFKDRWLLIIGVLLAVVAFCFYYFGRALIIVRGDAERKKAEDALRLNEKRLRRAEVVAHFGNWEFLLGRDEVRASDGAKIIYGLGDKEWSIASVQKIPLPEYRAMLHKALRELIEEDKSYNVEFKISRPSDGKIRDIHSIAEYSPEEGVVFGVIQDISERKLAEEALRESEARFRQLAENVSSVFWIADMQFTQILYVSPAYEKVWGRTCESLYTNPESWMNSVHPNDREEYLKSQSQRGSKGHSIDYRIIHADGSVRWISDRGFPVYNESGDIYRFAGIAEDITERKQADNSLRASEWQLRSERALLRALIDSIPDLIYFKDRDSVFLGCNKAFEIYSGVDEDSLIGKTDLEFAPSEIAEFYRQMDKEMFASGKAHRNEEWIPFKNGGGGHFDTIKTPYYGPDGELLGLIGVSRDITERRRMEEVIEKRLIALTRPLNAVGNLEFTDLFDLNEIQKLQDQFATAAGVASVITHVDGTPITQPSNFCELCETVIRQTQKGLRNCYYSDSIIGRHSPEGPIVQHCLSGGLWDAGASISVAGQHIANWLIGQVRDETQEESKMRAYAKEIGADEGVFLEAFFKVPTMSKDQFQKVAQALFTLAGQLSSMAYQNIQQARFITELKRAEEEKGTLEAQLFHAQRMESVGRLAGGVAHDFNNMLGVIIGHTELALNQAGPDESLRQDLLEILKAANRSADLTRQLLAFARKQTVNPKVLDLNDTIAGMLKMLRRLIGEDIDLAWMPGLDLWSVKIDPSQIDQMLANLAINASDAIGGVGKVTIETDNIQLDESHRTKHPEFVPGEFVQLTVSDTGAGMNQDVLEHIFEPFFTTKEVGQGTGLGLATVYGIVKQNEGLVYVDSELGRGTTFKIFLPRFAGSAVQTPSDVMAGAPLGGTETVLIVEDEKAILHIGETILNRLGYKVLSANSPKEAIRLAWEYVGEIHLLITDVVMPEMNGEELARRLASLKPSLKCLFMSGYTADIIAHHSILEEGVHFIQKPFSVKDMAEKTREALDS